MNRGLVSARALVLQVSTAPTGRTPGQNLGGLVLTLMYGWW